MFVSYAVVYKTIREWCYGHDHLLPSGHAGSDWFFVQHTPSWPPPWQGEEDPLLASPSKGGRKILPPPFEGGGQGVVLPRKN